MLADAIDTEHTAVTREGPEQPDQDDYGYESQEAAALYEKMMQKYNKMPEKPKFAPGGKRFHFVNDYVFVEIKYICFIFIFTQILG